MLQRNVLGFYLIFKSGNPTNRLTIEAAYVVDKDIFAWYTARSKASQYLQYSLNKVQLWLKYWRIKINENKLIRMFNNRSKNSPAYSIVIVIFNN